MICEVCGREDCDEWGCAVITAQMCNEWCFEWYMSEDGGSAVQSTIDDAVKEMRANTAHEWATYVAPGGDPNWDYCVRCGRKKLDLELPISGTYLPCKGFVG